jgi:hypothetical protein
MGIAYLLEQVVQFIEAVVDLRLESRLPFQNPPDLPFETGNPTSQSIYVSGGIADLRHSFPKELARFQFGQLVEGIAGIPQGVEPLPVGGKRFELCLYQAQITFENLEFPSSLLDLRVQWL